MIESDDDSVDFDAIATSLGIATVETSYLVVADTLRTLYVEGLKRAEALALEAAEDPDPGAHVRIRALIDAMGATRP